MSFTEFFSAIQSEPLRVVAQHWNEVRGSQRLPVWGNIQPSRIAGQLKLVWVYRYDRDTGQFTGRLAGDIIESVFGRSFRGTPMAELYPESDYERLHGRAERVVLEPALYRGDGRVFAHFERIGDGERIILPLADDGVHGDGLLGATIYEMANSAAPVHEIENEYWFSL